jgi:ribonuclease-3
MMGKGEESSGGRVRASALADAFEALVGAMYLDGGLDAVRRFLVEEAQPDIENLRLEPMDVNPKGKLQEILQSIAPQSPKYSIASQVGPEHSKEFTAVVTWQGKELGRGQGPSKKEAHIAAALDSLQRESWKSHAPDEDGASQ